MVAQPIPEVGISVTEDQTIHPPSHEENNMGDESSTSFDTQDKKVSAKKLMDFIFRKKNQKDVVNDPIPNDPICEMETVKLPPQDQDLNREPLPILVPTASVNNPHIVVDTKIAKDSQFPDISHFKNEDKEVVNLSIEQKIEASPSELNSTQAKSHFQPDTTLFGNQPQDSGNAHGIQTLTVPEVETSMYDPYGNLLIVSKKFGHSDKEYSPSSPMVSSQPISYESFANSVLNSSESLHMTGASLESMPKADMNNHGAVSKSKSLSPFSSLKEDTPQEMSRSNIEKFSSDKQRDNIGMQSSNLRKESVLIGDKGRRKDLGSQSGSSTESKSSFKAPQQISGRIDMETLSMSRNAEGGVIGENLPQKVKKEPAAKPTMAVSNEFENISGYYKKEPTNLPREPSSPTKTTAPIKPKQLKENEPSRKSTNSSHQTDIIPRREKQPKQLPSKTLIQDQVPSASFTVDHTPSPPPLKSRVVDKIGKMHQPVSQVERPNEEWDEPKSPVDKQMKKPLVLQPPRVSNLCLQPGERRSFDYSQFEFRKSGTPTNSSYQSVFREKEAAKATRPKSIYEMINMKGPAPYQSAAEIYEDIPVQQMSRSSPFLNEVLVGDVQETESTVILEQIQNAKTYSKHQNDTGKHQKPIPKKTRNLVEDDQGDKPERQKSPSKEKQATPPMMTSAMSSKTTASVPPSDVNLSSTSSHESHSVQETIISSNSETKITATETISKAAISEIVVTVPQEVVWKEEDELVETRVEKKILITHNEELDHDQALADAIHQATKMNPDLTVEKIEIRMENENES